MTTKEKVFKALSENRDGISGERLAMKLQISRCSVWKAVKSLREEGHEIEAVTNRGYKLLKTADRLDAEAISALCGTEVTVFDTVTSTNIIAKERAASGAAHGTAIIAANQTAGRGRRGRSFASAGEGIYMSVVLRPNTDVSHTQLITAAAAVAVCDALLSVCEKDCSIKWVNDILLDEKKICGILTEAVMDMEGGTIDSLVVGIGLNFCGKKEDLPEEIRDKAGFIFGAGEASATKNDLAAEVVKNLLRESDSLADRGFVESYRKRSSVVGKEIEYLRGGELITAVAVGIDENCALEVVRGDGVRETIAAGEVSVRKKAK